MTEKAGCAESTFRFLHKVVQLNKMYKGSDPSEEGSDPDWSSCQNSFKIDQHPHPLLPNPPQQQSRRMIHRHEDIPLPLSHPHPQFVAVKSLILNPPVGLLFTVLYYAGA